MQTQHGRANKSEASGTSKNLAKATPRQEADSGSSELIETLGEKAQNLSHSVQRLVIDGSRAMSKSVSKNPLATVGAAFGLGCAAGFLIPRMNRGRVAGAVGILGSEKLASEVGSLAKSLVHYFSEEFDMLKSLASEAFLNKTANFAKTTFPKLTPQIEKVMDSAMQKVTKLH